MSPLVVQAILTLITELPQALPELVSLYNTAKSALGSSDQATIEAALKQAQDADAADTAAADASLEAAAKN